MCDQCGHVYGQNFARHIKQQHPEVQCGALKEGQVPARPFWGQDIPTGTMSVQYILYSENAPRLAALMKEQI